MNVQQLIILTLCLWTAITTVAYLREYIRHKRLRFDLDTLLIRLMARAKCRPFADNEYRAAAQALEEILNKEK